VFLGTRRIGLYAAVVLLLARRRRAASAALAVWAAGWTRAAWRGEGSPARRLAAVPALLAIDAVTGAALIAGSVRAGEVVL
jgi:hypothetical protein